MKFVISTALYLLIIIGSCKSSTRLEVSKEFLSNLLTDYNPNHRPRPSLHTEISKSCTNASVATKVNLQVLIHKIGDLNDKKQELGLQITLIQKWQDNRLLLQPFNLVNSSISGISTDTAYGWEVDDYILLLGKDIESIWQPSLCIPSSKEPNRRHGGFGAEAFSSVRIHANGTVISTTGLALIVNCPMHFYWFPFDKQRCRIHFISKYLTADELQVTWDSCPIKLQEVTNNDETQIQLSHFTFTNFNLEESNHNYITNELGNFSCVTISLDFKRETSYYLVTIYIPTVMYVIISWSSFWFDVEAKDARMAVAVGTIFTMSMTTQYTIGQIPSTIYSKAIDTFQGTSLTIVMIALWELVLVNWKLRSSNNLKTTKKNSRSIKVYATVAAADNSKKSNNKGQDHEIPNTKDTENLQQQHGQGINNNKVEESVIISSEEVLNRIRAERIDRLARIIFPSSYFGFIFVYFAICMQFNTI